MVCRWWWWWVWGSEVNLQDQVFSPTLWTLGVELKSSDFGGNHLYLQSRFRSPFFVFEIGVCWTCMWEVGVRPMTWMWRSEDSFVVSVLSYLYVVSRNETQVSGSQWQAFYLLKPLAVETSSQLLDQILRPPCLHLQRTSITGVQHHDQQIVFWSVKLSPFYKVWLTTLVTLLLLSFLLLFPVLFLFVVFVFR